MRSHGRARVDPQNPETFAICDRCGFRYNHVDLRWQHEWQGNEIVNLRRLVCPTCLDRPHEFTRPVILPPDPVPIPNPRPEALSQDFGAPPPNVAVAQLVSGEPLPAPPTGLPSPRPNQFAD